MKQPKHYHNFKPKLLEYYVDEAQYKTNDPRTSSEYTKLPCKNSKKKRKIRNLEQTLLSFQSYSETSGKDPKVFAYQTHYAVLDIDDLYKRPGKIINKDIVIAHDDKVYLRPNLQEIYDYVTVDFESWFLLKEWYGYDYSVPVKPNTTSQVL